MMPTKVHPETEIPGEIMVSRDIHHVEAIEAEAVVVEEREEEVEMAMMENTKEEDEEASIKVMQKLMVETEVMIMKIMVPITKDLEVAIEEEAHIEVLQEEVEEILDSEEEVGLVEDAEASVLDIIMKSSTNLLKNKSQKAKKKC